MENLDMDIDTTSLQEGISNLEIHYHRQETTSNTNVYVGGNSGIQINTRPAEYQSEVKLHCGICYEEVNANEIHEIRFCHHRYCFSCMGLYVEYSLTKLDSVPKCPHEGCNSELTKSDCEKFLSTKLLEIFIQRLEEAEIQDSQKIYCPYCNCSALMDLSLLDRRPQDPSSSSSSSHPFPTTVATKCNKCHGLICIQCRVPWHEGISCQEYTSQSRGGEADLKLLAENQKWKRCPQCKRMIDRSRGCDHMTCRCGFEFCYKCGDAWYKGNGKKPICVCYDDDDCSGSD